MAANHPANLEQSQLSETGVDEQIDAESADRLGVESGLVPSSDWIQTRAEKWADLVSVPIVFAGPYEIYDFTAGYEPTRETRCLFGVGRYDEDRRGMYTSELFQISNSTKESSGVSRTVHMGVDLQAPAGTSVFAPLAGVVCGKDILKSSGDYGGVILIRSELEGRNLYQLFGHLSHLSIEKVKIGDRLESGERVGWLGEKFENGGWNPHLHYQLSWLTPQKADLPGAVTVADRSLARKIFMDPLVLLRKKMRL